MYKNRRKEVLVHGLRFGTLCTAPGRADPDHMNLILRPDSIKRPEIAAASGRGAGRERDESPAAEGVIWRGPAATAGHRPPSRTAPKGWGRGLAGLE